MNKKIGLLLTAATLVAGCDSVGQSNLNQVKNNITTQTLDAFNTKQEEDSTVLYTDIIEKGNVYDSLIQKVEAPIVSGDLTKKEMAITIDDGCGGKYTDQILDTLAKYNVKATFFIPGTRIRLHAKQWRRAINEGHQVCCHSYDHHYFRSSEPELLEQQILDWEQAVKDSLGEDYLIRMKRDFPFFRFPGGCGDSNPVHLDVLKKLGYLPIGWSDCTWKDGQSLNNGEIELFHVKPADFGRISNSIQQAQKNGFACKRLTEIVNPDEGYVEPITGKNLRNKRREIKK